MENLKHKILIGLIGEKLSGKDTAADFLVRKYKAEHFRTSHILDELLDVLDLPKTRQNEIAAGRGMEMVFGERVIGDALLSRINKSAAQVVVNNGLRQEYQFEDALKMGAKIIYITAPVEIRYERFLSRAEKTEDGRESISDFAKQEAQWIENKIPVLGAKADYKIENMGTLEEFYKKVEEIFLDIEHKLS